MRPHAPLQNRWADTGARDKSRQLSACISIRKVFRATAQQMGVRLPARPQAPRPGYEQRQKAVTAPHQLWLEVVVS